MRNVFTVILAGGKGTRLEPLTRDRAKPAVPFGGLYRIIDFTLSNCINSGLRRICVLTQYKARSLDRHLALGWSFLPQELGEFVEVLPPQQRIDEQWYMGTADAIYQNIYSIEKEEADEILILSGDHIYKMDYVEMVRFHREHKADLTVGCFPVPLEESDQFGILETDDDHQVRSFLEKPKTCPPMPGSTDHCLGSMGIYVFPARLLFEVLCEDAVNPESRHDFGKNIIPAMIKTHKVMGYRFQDKNRKDAAYWRDVGTLDAYYQANMDMVSVDPILNLYDEEWPIHTYQPQLPPPKFVFGEEGGGSHVRRGEAIDSLICQGSIISGGRVSRSVLSPNVRVNSYATVENSILFENVEVGRNSRIRNAIIDKDVHIPPGATIGFDEAQDRECGFTISDDGIVVIAKAELPETFNGD